MQHTAAAATCARASGVPALRLDWKFVETESNSRGCFVMKDAAIVSFVPRFFPSEASKGSGLRRPFASPESLILDKTEHFPPDGLGMQKHYTATQSHPTRG